MPAHPAHPLARLLLAIVGLWVFGTNDLLPILGYDKYPIIDKVVDIPFYPMGSLAALFMWSLLATAFCSTASWTFMSS